MADNFFYKINEQILEITDKNNRSENSDNIKLQNRSFELIDGNHLISKQNSLITSAYKLEKNELRLINILISKVGDRDTSFKEQRFRVADICNFLNLTLSNKHKEFQDTLANLQKKLITMLLEDGSIERYSWLDYSKYDPTTGEVILKLHWKLESFLLRLRENGNFTSYRLKYVSRFDSTHAYRIYELMCKIRKMKKRTVTYQLSKLKFLLGLIEVDNAGVITNEKYRNFADFKKRVLFPAEKEINERSDIEIKFIEIKKGRKIDAIKFTVKNRYGKSIPDKLKK